MNKNDPLKFLDKQALKNFDLDPVVIEEIKFWLMTILTVCVYCRCAFANQVCYKIIYYFQLTVTDF